MAYEPRTAPTAQDPAEYCAALPTARRRDEGARLLALFGEVTGEAAVMWGPSMIGYGQIGHRGTSVARGTWFRVGFSPRRAALSLYGLQGPDGASDLLAQLGKHRRGTGCVYVNGLTDIDEGVLRLLVALAWGAGAAAC